MSKRFNNPVRSSQAAPAAAAAIAAAMLATWPSAADITMAQWTDEENYIYHVNYMPDLDQKRAGLENDGSMYCVPTAAMNLLAYAAEWGFESLEPGPGVWNGDVSFVTMTNHIEDLGVLMQTDPDGGTSGGNAYDGLIQWLDDQPLVLLQYSKSEEWCPRIGDMAESASFGAIVMFSYGRYEFNDSSIDIIGDRTGGHAVTLMHTERDGNDPPILWSRDPADDDALFSQSAPEIKTYETDESVVYVDWNEDSAYSLLDVSVIGDQDDGKIRIIDTYRALCPLFGLGFSTIELNFFDIGGLDQFAIDSPAPQPFTPAQGTSILDVAAHPDLHSALVLTQGSPDLPGTISLVALRGGNVQPLLNLQSASRLVVGRNRDLYVLAGTTIRRIDLDGGQGIITTVPLITPAAQALAYRDSTDEIFVVSTTHRDLIVYPQSLGNEVEPVFIYDLPTFIPKTSLASLAINPLNGKPWLSVSTSDLLYELTIDGNTVLAMPFSHPSIIDPTSIAFDDRGHLLVTSLGEVLNFAFGSTGWQPAADSWYAGLEVSGRFIIARSRTNFEPALHDGPGWENLDPAEVADDGQSVQECFGDLNLDLAVGAADLAILLSAWGGPHALADLDADQDVGAADLANLLSAWGPCETK